MTSDVDQIIDRRKLVRALSFWRVAGVVALALALGIGSSVLFGLDHVPGYPRDQIARVNIEGYISVNYQRDRLFEKLAETDAIKAVIVSINSNGGATAGAEALYESLRRLAERKPTVATIGMAGASAAYIAAIATDHIVARRSSITGSIGAVLRYPEVSELTQKLGIRVEQIASSPLKADPRFAPISPEGRAVLSGVLNDTHAWFVEILAKRRGLGRSEANQLADGRAFTGRQALSSGLIDEIGGEKDAIHWLVTKRNIEAVLPVKDWKPKQPDSGPYSKFNSWLFRVAQRSGLLPDPLAFGKLESSR